MNSQHKAIRANLTSMSPNRAISYIKAFNLRSDEENAIIECDVFGKSYPQVQAALNMTPEVLKRTKRRAYAKIADELNNL